MTAQVQLQDMLESDALTAVASWLEACAQHQDMDRYGLPQPTFAFEQAWPLVLAIAQPARLYAHHMNIPQAGLHPATLELVASFARALAAKLRAAEVKYGWNLEWKTREWEAECRRELSAHVAKGDPLDVAAYAAFCWARGWSTALPAQPAIKAESPVLARHDEAE
jgi:hypothetical protein